MELRTKKKFFGFLSIFFAFLFALSLSMFFYNYSHAGKIYNNVYIGEINLQGKTKIQAKSIIEQTITKNLDNNLLILSSGKKLETKFSETGIQVDSKTMVEEAYKFGRNNNFFYSLILSAKTIYAKSNIKYQISFDNDIRENYIKRASSTLGIEPVNASLEIKNGQIVTNSSQSGVTIDISNLEGQIKDGFTKNNDYSFEVQTIPVTPELIADDLSEAKNQAEKYLNQNITLSLNEKTYTANRENIGNWISFKKESGAYVAALNSDSIKAFTNKIAAKNDISVIDTKVSAINGSILQEGRQGIYINQDEAVKKIISELKSSKSNISIVLSQYTKDPQVLTIFPEEGIIPGRFSGKYIDVDLTKQLLTIFDGVNQIGQFVISSGKPSMPTPTGTRTIINKSPRAWSNKYGLWMPWWMGIGGDYGLHELPEWPNGYKEGENHLGTPVSHGCVRLGVGPAQTVYNWADIGTPVYIHK